MGKLFDFIAFLSTFYYLFAWPAIKNNVSNTTKCANAICSDCKSGKDTCDCVYINGYGNEENVKCRFK